jgi:hypothetical protein
LTGNRCFENEQHQLNSNPRNGRGHRLCPSAGRHGQTHHRHRHELIRAGFDATCLQQALNARSAPGVTDLVLNPDAHAGYGAPVGCVLKARFVIKDSDTSLKGAA